MTGRYPLFQEVSLDEVKEFVVEHQNKLREYLKAKGLGVAQEAAFHKALAEDSLRESAQLAMSLKSRRVASIKSGAQRKE